MSEDLNAAYDLLRSSNGRIERIVSRGSYIMIGGYKFLVPEGLVGKRVSIRQEDSREKPCLGLYLDDQWVTALPYATGMINRRAH